MLAGTQSVLDVAIVQTFWTAASDAQGLARSHGGWMTWNLLLAAVPVGLAFLVFRPGIRRTASWWFGAVCFLLFLPNAPYVITDVVHLFNDIRYNARSDLHVLGEYVPLYGLFFAIGFGCYVLALDRTWRYVRSDFPNLPWWPIELSLQLLCAIGIYLGRVVRLNSWQVFTRPRQVLGAVDWLVGLFPIAMIAATFVALVAGTLLTRAVLYSVVRFVRGRGWQLPHPA
jgi:uncharacterized membrane protein